MRWLVVDLVVWLVACGSPPPKPASPSAPPPCAMVADHLVGLVKTAKAADAPIEVEDRWRRLFAERCTQDAWSPEAQKCLLGLAAFTDVTRCQQLLSDAQMQSFATAFQADRDSTTAPAH